MTILELRSFLAMLDARVPPHQGGHHAITACKYGSDATGWEDRLGLHVRVRDNLNQTFFLSDDDLGKPMTVLLNEVVTLVEKLSLPDARKLGAD